MYSEGLPSKDTTIRKCPLLPSRSKKQKFRQNLFVSRGDCRDPFDASYARAFYRKGLVATIILIFYENT